MDPPLLPALFPLFAVCSGDPANLAFGGLYRMDVARYRRVDPAGFAASLGVRRRGPGAYGVRCGGGLAGPAL